MDIKQILNQFSSLKNQKNIEAMENFGIHSSSAYGTGIPVLRAMAKQIGVNQALAMELWALPEHECKILATMIADPKSMDAKLADQWVKDFYSWDICDQCVMNLFEDLPFAYTKATEWALKEEEYIRRAGFVMIARLAISDKKQDDERFLEYFPLILEKSTDQRNFVKKAVNWAIRQIGKRSHYLNQKSLELLHTMKETKSPSSRWIANDAIRELSNEKITSRIKR
jgi:3-methyladenine DNA glycosylase AlkD